ncbi:MAG: B12-binding domain-containing radical SAM protein [Candidatus Woesearchaeota archaeon]
MRVLFVNPMIYLDYAVLSPYRIINLGPLYISSVLLKEGHYQIVKNVFKRKFTSLLKKTNPEILMITCMAEQQKLMIDFAKKAKSYNSKIIVIIGGYYPTFNYDILLEKYSKYFDYVVLGEGEETVKELIKSLEGKIPIEKVKGVAYSKHGKVVFNGYRDFVNLNKLPFPARFLIKDPVLYVSFSRGCPHNCSFCAVKVFYKRRLRFREPENIVEELKFILRKLKRNKNYHVILTDEDFIPSNIFINNFRNLIKKNKINLTFACSLRITDFSYNLFLKMYESNFRYFFFGIQNFNPEIRNFFNQSVSQKDLFAFFKTIKKISSDKSKKIKLRFAYIINSGHPFENSNFILKNAQDFSAFLKNRLSNKNLNINLNIILNPLRIWKGTDLFDYFHDKNYLINEKEDKNNDEAEYDYNYNDVHFKEIKNLFYKVKNILRPYSFYKNPIQNRFISFYKSSLSFKNKIILIMLVFIFIFKEKNFDNAILKAVRHVVDV